MAAMLVVLQKFQGILETMPPNDKKNFRQMGRFFIMW